MTAEQTARELAKAICGTTNQLITSNEFERILVLITQALKRYGNARLEEAVVKALKEPVE